MYNFIVKPEENGWVLTKWKNNNKLIINAIIANAVWLVTNWYNNTSSNFDTSNIIFVDEVYAALNLLLLAPNSNKVLWNIIIKNLKIIIKIILITIRLICVILWHLISGATSITPLLQVNIENKILKKGIFKIVSNCIWVQRHKTIILLCKLYCLDLTKVWIEKIKKKKIKRQVMI